MTYPTIPVAYESLVNDENFQAAMQCMEEVLLLTKACAWIKDIGIRGTADMAEENKVARKAITNVACSLLAERIEQEFSRGCLNLKHYIEMFDPPEGQMEQMKAAAPELYEALNAVVMLMPPELPARRVAQNALAKARGERI